MLDQVPFRCATGDCSDPALSAVRAMAKPFTDKVAGKIDGVARTLSMLLHATNECPCVFVTM